ncbi:hypothetical protein V499_00479 [Pseudogymnoascus sp. VKM F-103]|nr:hypothetical protein V499_00479 [Pseudogymnoascus sp. VKM F-103]
MMEDDLNSSDIEIGSPKRNRFHAAGLTSINAIIESAAADRLSSKRSQKKLAFTESSSKTQYITELWSNRFTTFRIHTLRQNIESTPTGADIERFLHSVISKSETRRDVPSLSWLKGGLERLLPKLLFDYQEFVLSRNETMRLKSTIRSLLQDGLVTDEPSRESNWVGSILIRRMAISSIADAASNGVYNWDKVVQRILRNVLLASLSCRIGDIMRDDLDDEEFSYLYYDDIIMKLVGGNKVENLEALISIRNEKRMGKTKKTIRVVFLQSLKLQQDNVLCTIKWILIFGLRSGAFQEKNIKDVLAATAARRDKTVQWAPGKGKLPVLCAFEGHWIKATKPGSTHQPKRLIRSEGLHAGLLAPIRTHDVRRGAARDIAHLPEGSNEGLATDVVAAAMGHSDATRTGGVTKKYIGYARRDNWAQRVNAEFNDPFGVTVAPAAFQARRRSRAEWAQIYREAGLDVSNYQETLKLRNRLRAEEEDSWIQMQRGFPSQSDAPVSPGSAEYQDSGDGGEDDEEGEDSIDPLLRGNITSILAGDEQDPNEEIIADIFDEVESPMKLPAEFDLPGPEFVTFMSRINVVKNAKDASRGFSDKYRGNSRAEPTLFLHKCTKTAGCKFTSPLQCLMRIHEHRCTGVVVAARSRPKQFACTYEGCSKVYGTKSTLRGHVANKHRWTTRFCKKGNCDGTIGYTSPLEFGRHTRTAHSRWESRHCPVGGCTHSKKFTSKAILRVHLMSVHDISGKVSADLYGVDDDKRRQGDGADGGADGDEEMED